MRHSPAPPGGAPAQAEQQTPAERDASASGERRAVADAAAMGMGILRPDGRWLSANAALAGLLGHTQAELSAMSLHMVTHPHDVATDEQELERLVRGEIVSDEREKRLLHRSGAPIWVRQRVTLSRDDAGRALHFIWQGWDVTEERRVREAHTEMEAMLQLVVANAPVLLWSIDPHGVFTLVQGQGLPGIASFAEKMAVGRSAYEMYGDVRVVLGDGTTTTGDELLRRALGGVPCSGLAEIGASTYDTKMVPLRGAGGQVAGVIGVATDVTERARADAALRASAASFRTLIEQAPELVVVHRDARIVYVNPAAAAAFAGGDRGALRGREVVELVHPEERERWRARVEHMMRTGEPAPSQELRLLRLDGEALDVELVGMPLVFEGALAIVSIGRDVGARKRVQAHLLQNDRMAALGTLASGVAHEINNPLTYVMGNVDLVSRILEAKAAEYRQASAVSGADVADELDDIVRTLGIARDGAQRVRGIVRDLTTFARSAGDTVTLLDVRAVLEPVINLVSNEVRRRARLTRHLGEVPLVEANESRLGQVFMSLLINAAQAIPDEAPEGTEHEVAVTTLTDDQGRAVIEVRDTGAGMSEEVLGHIFEPFFTTKAMGIGTGLGLSICHGIVTALGGEITVRTTPGAGSVFRVALPAARLRRG